jgi:hypothetical protein
MGASHKDSLLRDTKLVFRSDVKGVTEITCCRKYAAQGEIEVVMEQPG